MGDIDLKLQQLLEHHHQLQQNLEQLQQHDHGCSVKLPELEIPTFDCDRLQWREFWDFFHVTVDQNVHLSDVEKFCYLKDRLIGEAKHAISGISVSQENYSVVKTLLKERFEDTQLVIHHHYTDLINLTPATNSSKGLRFVYDKIESNLRSLEALQQDINHDIFISIISSKIPKDVYLQMELQKGAKNKWSIKKLRELLNNYICATERAEELAYSEESERETGSSRTNIMGRTLQTAQENIKRKLFVICRFCDGNHWSDQCLEYPTLWDRKQHINDSCFRCLKRGHIAYKCIQNKSCFYCGRRNHHDRSLCPLKFATNEKTSSAEKEIQPFKGESQITETKKEYSHEPAKNTSICITHMQSENTHGAKQEATLGQEAEHMAIISEENNDPGQKEIHRFADELAKEIADLQLRHTELSNKLLSMKENISNLQKQNNDLETEQSKVSALMKFKHKLADDKGQSICVASPWNIKVGQDSTNININETSECLS